MPHIELKYSQDLEIEPQKIFTAVEECINQVDASSGECKGRAYPAEHFYHSHFYLSLSMLPKPHRDEAFIQQLSARLCERLKALLPLPCFFSLEIRTMEGHYVTMKMEE